jgi:HK97 family phage prohead protease
VTEHKNIDAEFKDAADDGTFVALASVFNNVDRVGDRVLPGAFTQSLRQWRASGKMLPIILAHNWKDIQAHIGYADPKQVRETSKGLQVKAHLDISESETAKRVHTLMKRGQLTAMSFGYSVPDGGQELDSKGVNEINQIDLHEVGPTLVGANPDAQIESVKSALRAETKAEEPGNEEPEEKSPTKSDAELRKAAEQAEREQIAAQLKDDPGDPEDVRALESILAGCRAYLASELVEADSEDAEVMEGVIDVLEAMLETEEGELEDEQKSLLLYVMKAVWSGSYINELPDSAFLLVESGGEKDADGKTTPRSLRHFPYKDSSGTVDVIHVRNALSRIPQSNLPSDVKDRLTRKAEAILQSTKAVEIEDGEGEEPAKAKSVPQDPLRARSLETVLEISSAGISNRKPSQAPAPDVPDEKELRRRSRDLELELRS